MPDLPLVLLYALRKLFAVYLDIQLEGESTAKGLLFLIQKFSYDAIAIPKWAEENRLKLNTRKTDAMIFGSGSCLNALSKLPLPLNSVIGTPIPFAESLKSLGIIITHMFHWYIL